ncbi:polysaccharide deacetylase family protein [Pseudooceanicola sp.]|uniref:polysaccharide deacetylase family protein n=1 Tax=Pseudooceanicola sp. TaxID=1914328 RepID=UPI003511BA33
MLNANRFRRPWKWPNGQRVAVTIGLPFEAFHRQSQVSLISKPGQIDTYSLSYGDYGWKAGIWRLLEILDRFGCKGTSSVNGMAAERHPEIVSFLAEEGHELMGHGWANDVYVKDMTPEEARSEIRRCTEVLTECARGVRPTGWTSPGSTGPEGMLTLLKEEGYLYCGDDVSDDIPFIIDSGAGDFVILPRQSVATNDITQWVLPKNSPLVMWEGFKETFDALYEESSPEHGRWIDLTLHAHMAGRPTMKPVIERMLSYALDHDGVFLTRKQDIAEWTLESRQVVPSPI